MRLAKMVAKRNRAALLLLLLALGCVAPAQVDTPGPVAPTGAQADVSALPPAATTTPPRFGSAATRGRWQADLQTLRQLGETYGFLQFLALAASPEVLAELIDASPVTLFAPSDDALEALPAAQREVLRQDAEQRTAFVLAHVVRGHLTVADLVDLGTVPTLLGTNLHIEQTPSWTQVGQVPILVPDVNSPLGIVHILDRSLAEP
jgi:uncharacterized surface protein with fasciclin (FAS1) repeats